MDVKNLILTGSSSHIFFFDVFNDTGVVGLFSIIAVIVLLKTSSIVVNFLNNNTCLNECLFCFGSIVFFKLIIASDSYSEPLLVTFLVLLILSFKRRLKGEYIMNIMHLMRTYGIMEVNNNYHNYLV